jgi:electron transfer flavoprotein beta subunit
MKIAVCVKQVAAIADEVEFDPDERDVDRDFVDRALNEWDTYALEEALRIRDERAGEVLVLTVGDAESEEMLRRCAAMGADRVVRVSSAAPPGPDPIAVARALGSVLGDERPDLVLCGAQSSDAVQGATASALAGLLGLPVVAVVRRIELRGDGTSAVVDCELERGVVDVTEVDLPAVLSVQTGINEPRYVTLRAIHEAAARGLPVVETADDGPAGYRVRRMFLPERRQAAIISGSPADIARRILEIVEETVR